LFFSLYDNSSNQTGGISETRAWVQRGDRKFTVAKRRRRFPGREQSEPRGRRVCARMRALFTTVVGNQATIKEGSKETNLNEDMKKKRRKKNFFLLLLLLSSFFY
jgi:ferric-dicitrate binding protein FerR (iron transport regulator)